MSQNRVVSTLCHLPPAYIASVLFLFLVGIYMTDRSDAMIAEFLRYLFVGLLTLLGISGTTPRREPIRRTTSIEVKAEANATDSDAPSKDA